jgi:hypothetical protein
MIHYRCQQEIRAENTLAVTRPDMYGVCWSYDLEWNRDDAWFSVIRGYSGRKLTYPFDKLPALSSLAGDMKKKKNWSYLAGIWREKLVWSLLWECIDLESDDFYSDIAPVRCEKYRAPSWSWAAGDGAVEWQPPHPPKKLREEVLVVEAKTEVAGEDPLGRVTGGSLTLTGKVQHISSLASSLESGNSFGSFSAACFRVVVKGVNIMDSYVSIDWSSPLDVLDRIHEEGVWLLLLASYPDPHVYSCVYPHASDAEKSDIDCTLMLSGLLLSPIEFEEEELKKFRRVGMFRIFKKAGGQIFRNSQKETIIII